jgi:hypothetical protein
MINEVYNRIEKEVEQSRNTKKIPEDPKLVAQYERTKRMALTSSLLWTIPFFLPIMVFLRKFKDGNDDEFRLDFPLKFMFYGFLTWYLALSLKMPLQILFQLRNAPPKTQDDSDSKNIKDKKWQPKIPPNLTLFQADVLAFASGFIEEILRFIVIFYIYVPGNESSIALSQLFTFQAGWLFIENIMALLQLVTKLTLIKRTDERANSGKIMLQRTLGLPDTSPFKMRPYSALLTHISRTLLNICASYYAYVYMVHGINVWRLAFVFGSAHACFNLFTRYSYRVSFRLN